jgi:hypothetical protein
MTTAASRPIMNEASPSSSARASSIGWPPRSTWSPPPFAASASSISFLVSSFSISLVKTSYWTVA